MSVYLLAAALWIIGLGLSFGYLERRTLRRLWREPALRSPVVIIESDDWGPGPVTDAGSLQRLSEILARYRDSRGRPAVMTLGIVLAVPDTQKVRSADGKSYYPALLSHPQFAPILAAIRKGIGVGVFSPQLHGMEHYWPSALMKAAKERQAVRDWLTQSAVPRSEELPAVLQSRWIDASELPSLELEKAAVTAAAKREMVTFRHVLGVQPLVVVPPTFIWSDAVEEAWSAEGARVVVTPGRRYSGRDANGRPSGGSAPLHNCETGPSGAVYMVRDDYFEPALGHRTERALAAIAAKTRAGRPTLLESHRFNFTGTSERKEDAFRETELLLHTILQRYPHVRFLSTLELADAMKRTAPDLVEKRVAPRAVVWFARVSQVSRLRKLAWVSGAVVPALLAYAVLRMMSSGSFPRSKLA